MFWRKRAYWFRGGLIGASISFIWVVAFYGCLYFAWVDILSIGSWRNYDFLCMMPVYFGPMNPIATFLYESTPAVIGDYLPFVLVPIATILVYFLVGAIFGTLVKILVKQFKSN